ncbi:uncharacterized protein FIESC28_00811 [Fusarium coffeatum]|uniref:Uncharacterized protein n=1 Tax=Fusarium coffeatum TaxID=231269 RepID=A0A366SCM1_9HYPO|nr:uncharacterized protein FIESC28_00811 [Fusarium coffeatum]RBR26406.1 hypothetical protein FIESC28_00811 [Fusarium coffeatum]
MNHKSQAPDSEETCDITPDRPLTGKEAEEDYQKQLDVLAKQNTEYEKAQKKSASSSTKTAGHCN